MILSTPYLHVQAIRRRYRDEGKPTIAKPAGYNITLNLPNGNVGTTVTSHVLIDSDSDFIWLSTYYYVQDAAWDPEVRGNGEITGDAGERNISLEILSTGRTLSNPREVYPSLFDWGAHPFGGNDTGSEMQDGPTANEGEFGILRCYLPEPIVVKGGDRIGATLRIVQAAAPLGHVLLLSGVRLFMRGG